MHRERQIKKKRQRRRITLPSLRSTSHLLVSKNSPISSTIPHRCWWILWKNANLLPLSASLFPFPFSLHVAKDMLQSTIKLNRSFFDRSTSRERFLIYYLFSIAKFTQNNLPAVNDNKNFYNVSRNFDRNRLK